MVKKQNKKIIILLAIAMLLILNIANITFAVTTSVVDTTQLGNISMTVYEYPNGIESNKRVLEGAEFKIYSILETVNTVSAAETYITGKTSSDFNVYETEASDEDGELTFSNLPVGRYYIKETDAPKYVYTKVESFIVDIPSTNSTGDAWNYNIVASPKNVTIYANVIATVKNKDAQIMQGVQFKLQKENTNSNQTDKYEDYAFLEGENLLTTNAQGKITINNLEPGKYRLVELSTLDGYIVDQSNPNYFEVTLREDGVDIELEIINEKVKVNQYVKASDNSYKKNIGVNTMRHYTYEDLASWKITATIPSMISTMDSFVIFDEVDESLVIKSDSIEVYGIKNDTATKLTEDTNYLLGNKYNTDSIYQDMKITFINRDVLENYDSIEVRYDTYIQPRYNSTIDTYGTDYKNEATVKYTDVIDKNGNETHSYRSEADNASTANVHTGRVVIYKTDGTTGLAGAEFKIASSYNDAKNGNFLNFGYENYIVYSDYDGYVYIWGLAYGNDDVTAANGSTSYWIAETQAPSYEDENGNTKYYNLLKEPVEIVVNATSGTYVEGVSPKVINKKAFDLPMTGSIGILIFALVGTTFIILAFILNKKDKKYVQNNQK